ncbi:Acetylxylan esterase 2 [Cytospora mali]|uniref:Acetylxylan esterase 2 n=1 Tax=Cytospora mali TaxID=578113 RepID=A0A194VFK4_CYTMA|nr:Acetylxylan esterase 2 [Valsa mali var. pyri (nom. inval.)]
MMRLNSSLVFVIAAFVLTFKDGRVMAADCSTNCTSSGAHIIVARESGAPNGVSVMDTVAEEVAARCPGSDISGVPYPAEFNPYVESEGEGIGNLTEMVLDYQSCCPDSQVVLMGYSQGAQVTADFLCGNSETGFPETEAYASSVTDIVAAIVLMGDPSFVAGLPWDNGTADNVSYFPRLNTSACDPVAGRMISYCDANDYYCDSGTSIVVHANYVTKYHSEATDFVVELLGGC